MRRIRRTTRGLLVWLFGALIATPALLDFAYALVDRDEDGVIVYGRGSMPLFGTAYLVKGLNFGGADTHELDHAATGCGA